MRKELWFPNAVAAAFVAASLVPGYWWIVDRDPAAIVKSEVISEAVKQGDFLEISYDVQWRASCKITAFRYIIDSMSVQWDIDPSERIVDPDNPVDAKFTIRVPVPLVAAPGTATYRGTIRYECNPLQRFWPLEQDLRTRTFEIIAGDNPSSGVTRGAIVLEAPGATLQIATLERN